MSIDETRLREIAKNTISQALQDVDFNQNVLDNLMNQGKNHNLTIQEFNDLMNFFHEESRRIAYESSHDLGLSGEGVIQRSEKEVPIYMIGDAVFYDREEAEQYIEASKILLNRSYYLITNLHEENIALFSEKCIIGSDSIDEIKHHISHYDKNKRSRWKLTGVKHFSSFTDFDNFLRQWKADMSIRERRKYGYILLPEGEELERVAFAYIGHLARLEKGNDLAHSPHEISESTALREYFTVHGQDFFSLEEAKRHVKFVEDLVERDKAKFSNCRC